MTTFAKRTDEEKAAALRAEHIQMKLLDGGTYPLLWEYLGPILRAAQLRLDDKQVEDKHEAQRLEECIREIMKAFPYDTKKWDTIRQFLPRKDALHTNGQWPVFRLTLSSDDSAVFPPLTSHDD